MNVNTKEIPFQKGELPEMNMIQKNTKENLFENIQPSDRENPKYRETRSSQPIGLENDAKMNAIFQNVVYGEGPKENYTTFQFQRQEDIGEDEKSAIRKVFVTFSDDQRHDINRWIYLDKKT
ncbi:hypothetical protein IJM86_00600 [bacterium]|nr:hypothetical protein [bacterium]